MSTTRWGSALIANVEPSWLGRLLGGGDVERSQALMGGIWVGGKITITDETISYHPLWWDRYLHVNLQPLHVPLREVNAVSITDQGVTGTVFVRHTQGEFIFRCYRAEQAAMDLSDKIQRRHRLAA